MKYKFKLRKYVARCCCDSRLRGAISARLNLQTQKVVNILRAERAIAARPATTCGLLDLQHFHFSKHIDSNVKSAFKKKEMLVWIIFAHKTDKQDHLGLQRRFMIAPVLIYAGGDARNREGNWLGD